MALSGDTILYDQRCAVKARAAAEEAAAATPATDSAGRALRHDGWTPDRQRLFLAAIAQGHTVTDACRQVGLSAAGAYALRTRAPGSAFALGWSAANLLAREPLADRLTARALDGQVEYRTLPSGERVERFRYDNGLATRMLARLDRQADSDGPVRHAAARLVAGEFDAFLDLIGRGEGPARAGLFLAARAGDDPAADLEPVLALARADRFARTGAALATEIDTADLDLAGRAAWTGEQWCRAEAAGLLRVAPEPAPAVAEAQDSQLVAPRPRVRTRIWWDDECKDWRTDYPPPDDFDGDEERDYGEDFYERSLTEEEHRLAEIPRRRALEDERRADAAERDQWIAAATAELGDDPAIDAPAMQGDEEPLSAPSCERAAGLTSEGEDRPDRQRDGRDGQQAAGQRFHEAHCLVSMTG